MTESFQEHLMLLRKLQEIDLNLHNCRIAIEKLPPKIADVKAERDIAEAELDAVKAELAELEASKKGDEANLAESSELLRAREAKLFAIKTNKEYQATIKEISEGKRINREREDRILQSMEKNEELTEKSGQLETIFADKDSVYSDKKQMIDQEEVELRKIMEVSEADRPGIVEQIDTKILRKYDSIRKHYVDTLVEVVGGVCSGCSTKVTPQTYNEMLRQKELKVCTNCQRLVYVNIEPSVEPGEEAKAETETE
jgi:uncharacterized protein